MRRLSALPWWTPADAAELELLTVELLRVAAMHHDRCRQCSERGPWCADLRDAFEAVDEWRRMRELRSRAAWLRARQWLAEPRAGGVMIDRLLEAKDVAEVLAVPVGGPATTEPGDAS